MWKLGLDIGILKRLETPGNTSNMSENHGAPGSSPGLATSFRGILQGKYGEKE